METKTKKSFMKRIKWKRVILIMLTLIIVTAGSTGVYFAWNIYQETADFDANMLLSGEPSKMYDANGDLIYTFGSDENGKRINVTYEDLPQVLVDAVVSAEDSRYFEHDGFDLPRIVKAFVSNLAAGQITGGGSTITQQVIKKSYFPAEEQTYTRKFSEIFLAMEATKELSKEDILTNYLNKIYFGRSLSSIGVGAASQYYFAKDVSQLTLPEAALLAGTLNSPSSYDPYYNLELATSRRNLILDLMVDHGYISQEECDDAKSIPVENTLSQNSATESDAFQAYIDLVVDEVEERTGMNPAETQMNIYTHLNPDLQRQLDDLVKNYDFPDEYMEVGISIQNTQDGRIISVIGGRNYKDFGTNRADIKQQPGSCLKPVIDYGAAFEFLNWSTGHEVEDKDYNKGGYNPNNWNNQVHGKMQIDNALFNSWNNPAIWTLDAINAANKFGDVYDMLVNMGVDMEAETREFQAPFAIGGWAQGTSPMEVASIYATIGNGGTHVKSHTVNKITLVEENKDLNIDEEIQANTNLAMSEEATFMIREVQKSYMGMGGDYGNYLNKGQFLAKTGTTNHPADSQFKGAAKDSWLASYNPDYAFAVWMGYDQKVANETGLTMNRYMLESKLMASEIEDLLLQNGVTNSFPAQPSGVFQAQMVKGLYPYKSPSANIPADKIVTAWFKTGFGPDGTAEDLGINTLTSFDATINSNGQITVNFAPYDPVEAVSDPETNDATKLYGCVRYAVNVKDATTGEILKTYVLESPTATLDYIPTSSVNVVGYYTYQNSTSLHSNEIVKKLDVDTTLSTIKYSVTYNGSPINGSLALNNGQIPLNVSVTRQVPNSTVTVALLSENGTPLSDTFTLTSSNSCTVTLTAAGTYKIQITESYNGSDAPTAIYTVVAS
jgi:penicillin-binding protein 1A